MTARPWLRRAEVLVGPLSEWRADQLEAGPSNTQASLSVFGDGTENTFRIKFNVRLHAGYIAPASVIEIYNLKAETRAALNKIFAAVILRVGWKNTEMEELFSGSLMVAHSRREGPDIVTALVAISSFEAANTAVTNNGLAFGGLGTIYPSNWLFDPGTPLIEVVAQLASELVGAARMDRKLIEVPDVKIGSGGLTIFGKVLDLLADLGRNYGFTWWLDKGLFHAHVDNQAPRSPAILVSAKNGTLLRAEPLLSGIAQRYGGITFRALLNPQIRPGAVVQVESQINPFLNNPWMVQGVTYTGDTHGEPWYADCESLIWANYN